MYENKAQGLVAGQSGRVGKGPLQTGHLGADYGFIAAGAGAMQGINALPAVPPG
jgi:hypothetical protein